MSEPQELIDARRCLASAEADLGSEEGCQCWCYDIHNVIATQANGW